MEHKFLLWLGFMFLIIPFVSAQTQIYGGETKTIWSSDLSESCVDVFVIVNASKLIEFNNEGVREYSLENCEYHVGGSLINDNKYFDLWVCDCSDGKFDLVLSVLANTVNTYVFSLAFYNESLIDVEDENSINEQTFVVTARSARGGGICMTQWTCTEWSECDNYLQTRICSYPSGFCEPNEQKPSEIQSCIMKKGIGGGPQEILLSTPQSPGFFATITGAVIGALGTGGTIIAIIFILAVMTGFVIVILNTRKEKLKNKESLN